MVFFFKQDRSTLSDCSHGTCNGFSAQTEPISQCDNDSGDPVRVSVVADNQSVAMKMDKTIRLEPPHFDEEKITAGGTNERVSRIVLLFNATDLAHLQSRRIHSLTD